MPGAGGGDRRHDRQAFIDAEVEAHLGQLDADVGVEGLGGDALDRLDVCGRGPVGRGPVGHRLAEHVERGGGARGIQGPDRGDRLVERRAGHEPERHAPDERRGHRHAAEPSATGEPQEERAQRAGQHQSRRPWLQPRARSTARRISGFGGIGPSP